MLNDWTWQSSKYYKFLLTLLVMAFGFVNPSGLKYSIDSAVHTLSFYLNFKFKFFSFSVMFRDENI